MQVFIFLAFLLALPSNDYNLYLEDYSKIVEAYTKPGSISFKVIYRSFDTSLQRPDTSLTGTYKFKANKFYVKLAQSESVKNDKYYLSIDHFNRIMFLSSASAVSGNFFPVATIDTLIKKGKLNVRLEELSGGSSRRYTVNYNQQQTSAYKSVSIEFDRKTSLIEKVVMRLNKPETGYEDKNSMYLQEPLVEMAYTSYSFSEIDESAFSISKFISTTNGLDATLKAPYDKYQLINSIAIRKQMK